MYNNGNYERLRSPQELLQEELLMQIPSDPQRSEIVEILSKNPSVTSYIGNILNGLKNTISMKKLILDKKEAEYKRKISEHRSFLLENYRRDLVEHLRQEPGKIKELCQETGLTRVEARDIVKLMRPDKPTSAELEDNSVLKQQGFYDEEIYPLKQEIIELEKNFDEWKVKYNLYENNFKASQSIKGLIQQENT